MVHELKVPAGWICTDPDAYQFMKVNEDGSHTFKELNEFEFKNSIFKLPEALDIIWDRCPHYWKIATVFISDFSRQEIHEVLLAYYNEEEIKEVANIDNPEHHALIAECLFETEMYYE